MALAVGLSMFMSELAHEDVVLVERDEDKWVYLLLILCIILQKCQQEQQKLVERYRIKGLVINRPGLVILGFRNIFELAKF
jgi:hypothetical protein